MKQPKGVNRRLMIADLLYAYRQVAELKGYIQTFGDAQFDADHRSQLELSLQSIKSVIQYLTEGEPK